MSGVVGLKELLNKAKTPREIASLIENEYDEDEMGREYISSTNFHDELKFLLEKDVVEFFKDKVVTAHSEYDGQVHVDRKQLQEFTELVRDNPSRFIFKGTVRAWMKRCGLEGSGSDKK